MLIGRVFDLEHHTWSEVFGEGDGELFAGREGKLEWVGLELLRVLLEEADVHGGYGFVLEVQFGF